MERTVTAVEVDADDNNLMKLTLGSAVAMMDTITVSYTDPSADNDSNAVQDSVGNDLLTFAAQSVINSAPAGVTISSVALNSDPGTDKTYAIDDVVTATVTFSEAVTVTGTPQLTIDVGGTDKTLNYSSGSGSTGLVFSGYMVAADDTAADGIAIEANKLSLNGATLSKTSAEPGGVVLTHAAVAADSDHKVDGVLPTLVITGGSAPHASSDRSKIILTFSETIATVDRSKITVKSGTADLTTTADSKSGITVEITLTTALTMSATDITVTLAEDAVTDGAGNGIAMEGPIAVSLEDTTAPVLTGVTTPTVTEVLLSYDEALDSSSIPNASRFTVNVVGGAGRTVSSVAASGTMGIVLTISPAFALGDTLTITYTVPTTNPIQDAASNDAAGFTDRAVTNTLAVPGKPTGLAAGTVTPTTIPLTWTAPTDPGTGAITGYSIERAPDVSGSAGTWAVLGTGNATSYTDEDLAPETKHHYRVSASNAVGTGAASDATSGTTAALPVITIAVSEDGMGNPLTPITEGETALFTVTFTGNTSELKEITTATTQSGDFLPNGESTGSTTFQVGLTSVSTFELTEEDFADEADGSVTVTLQTGSGYTIGTPSSATVTIEDNDHVPGTPVLSARPDNEQVELTWPKPASGTSEITRYDYRSKEASAVTGRTGPTRASIWR